MAKWVRIGAHAIDLHRVVAIHDASMDVPDPREFLDVFMEGGKEIRFAGNDFPVAKEVITNGIPIDEDPTGPGVSYGRMPG